MSWRCRLFGHPDNASWYAPPVYDTWHLAGCTRCGRRFAYPDHPVSESFIDSLEKSGMDAEIIGRIRRANARYHERRRRFDDLQAKSRRLGARDS